MARSSPRARAAPARLTPAPPARSAAPPSVAHASLPPSLASPPGTASCHPAAPLAPPAHARWSSHTSLSHWNWPNRAPQRAPRPNCTRVHRAHCRHPSFHCYLAAATSAPSIADTTSRPRILRPVDALSTRHPWPRQQPISKLSAAAPIPTSATTALASHRGSVSVLLGWVEVQPLANHALASQRRGPHRQPKQFSDYLPSTSPRKNQTIPNQASGMNSNIALPPSISAPCTDPRKMSTGIA